MKFISVLIALFSILTITSCYEGENSEDSEDSEDSCGTYMQDRCMTNCVGDIPNMIFQLNNVCLQMNTTNETRIEEKYFNVISKCIDYCNVTLALSSHSNGGRSLITYILESNFGLLRGQVNMVAAQEATYYITGHSKKKCKGAINWEMDLSAGGECENTGSPGGDSAKIWNNDGAQFL